MAWSKYVGFQFQNEDKGQKNRRWYTMYVDDSIHVALLK